MEGNRMKRFAMMLCQAVVLVVGGMLVVPVASTPTVVSQPVVVNGKDGKKVVKRGRGYKAPAAEVKAARHKEAFKRHGYRMHRHVSAMTAPSTFDSTTLGWV